MATKSFAKRATSIINSHKIRLGEDFDRGDKKSLEAMDQQLGALQQEQLQAQAVKAAKDQQFQDNAVQQFQDGGKLNRRQQTSISQLLQQAQQGRQQQGLLPQGQPQGIPQGIPQGQFQGQFQPRRDTLPQQGLAGVPGSFGNRNMLQGLFPQDSTAQPTGTFGPEAIPQGSRLPQGVQSVPLPQPNLPQLQQDSTRYFAQGGNLPQYQNGGETRGQVEARLRRQQSLGATAYGQAPANDPNLELEFWMTQPFGERPKWLQKLTRGIKNIAELNKPHRAAARQNIMNEIVAKRETIGDVAKRGTTAAAQVPIASDSQIDANKYLNFTQNLINDRSPLSAEEQASVANAPDIRGGRFDELNNLPGYNQSGVPVYPRSQVQAQQAQGVDAITGATIPAGPTEIPGVTITGQRPQAGEPTTTPVGTGIGQGGGQGGGGVGPGNIGPGNIFNSYQGQNFLGRGVARPDPGVYDQIPPAQAGQAADVAAQQQQQGFDMFQSRVPWYGHAAQGLGSILANRQLDLGALEGVEDVSAQRIAPRLVDYSRSREEIRRAVDRQNAQLRQAAKQRGTQQGLTQSVIGGGTEIQQVGGQQFTASQEAQANRNQEITQGADIFNAQQQSLADRTNLGIAMQRSQLERQNALINAGRRGEQIAGVAGAIQGFGQDVFSARQYDQMINLGMAGKDFGFSQEDPNFWRRFTGQTDPASIQFNNPNLRISS